MVECVTSRKAPNTLVQIHGIEYEVLTRLSFPNRGRWKVRGDRPPPDGTLYTVIDVVNSPAAVQFKASLAELPKNSSGIPRLVDFDQVDGRLRMVVTWCEGIDLDSYFKRVDREKSFHPTVWESIRRIRSLALLCGVLHRDCRIIHGDIKPANLVLPKDRGSIAIIDFGSSWQIEGTRGRDHGDGADRHYSAPEVFQKEAIVDDRADQFSVAVVLYRMLVGELPYGGLGGQAGDPNYRDRFAKGIETPSKESAELQTLPDSIRDEIDGLLRRSLSLNPDQRFPSTRAFSNALDSIYEKMRQAGSTKPSDKKKANAMADLFKKTLAKIGFTFRSIWRAIADIVHDFAPAGSPNTGA